MNYVVNFLLVDRILNHNIIFDSINLNMVWLKKIIFYSLNFKKKIMIFLNMDQRLVRVLVYNNGFIILRNLLLNLSKVFQPIVIILKYHFLYRSVLFKIQIFAQMISFEDNQMIYFLNEDFVVN